MTWGAGLRGPVDVALAKAAETLPRTSAMAGGARYELKWDGYRCGAVVIGHRSRVWSRQGTDLSERFPDICAALADAVDEDVVLDGELVVWGGDRLDFDALQTRMTAKAARLATLAWERPASYVAFDLLACGGHDLRDRPCTSVAPSSRDWRPVGHPRCSCRP